MKPEYLKNFSFEDLEEAAEKDNSLKTKAEKRRDNISFSILEKYGSLSDNKYSPVFSKIDWNGYVKYDLRKWKGEMQTPAKGITFDKEELEILLTILDSFEPKQEYLDVLYKYHTERIDAEILYHLGVLSSHTMKNSLWRKEINIVDWGYGAKVDLRKWSENYHKCSKGISISFDEAIVLKSLVKDLIIE